MPNEMDDELLYLILVKPRFVELLYMSPIPRKVPGELLEIGHAAGVLKVQLSVVVAPEPKFVVLPNVTSN